MRNPKTQSTMRPAALLLFLTMCFIYLYVLVGLPMKGSIPLPFIVVGRPQQLTANYPLPETDKG